MLPKRLVKDYLSFTRTDRIFTVLVVLIITGSLTLPQIFAPSPPPLSFQQDSALVLALDTLLQRQTNKAAYRTEDNSRQFRLEPSGKSYTDGALFSFEPNTATFEDWRKMGLNERTSKTILNYVSKGGRFYQPEDLLKIWGMPEGFFERVRNYIAITSVQRKVYPSLDENKPRFEREERKLVTVNVNLADTSALIALPGIGSKLSARIIAFRDKLGGFHSVEQIGETYGLPDSTFQKIKGRLQVDGANIRKINLNTATKDELKAHPYIKWNLANAIVEYRNQHGDFKSLEELKEIVLVDEATFTKLVTYLDL
jgi:competence ComEA-like helix-hairpin-helix protein